MNKLLILLLVFEAVLLTGCGVIPATGELKFSPEQLLFESDKNICSGEIEGYLVCNSKARFSFANQSTHFVRLEDSTRGFTLSQENMPPLKVKLRKGQRFHFTIEYNIQISDDGRELIFDFAESGYIKVPTNEMNENIVELKFEFDEFGYPWSVIQAFGYARFEVTLPEEAI